MAQIRRSIFWAAHPFVVLVSFLFSVIHFGPPAWAKTDGNTEPRQDEVTALIGELCENERFEHCLGEELQRLVQAAPEPELAPLNQLAPAPDVLLRRQPGAQMQQQPSSSAQPQQGFISWNSWNKPDSSRLQKLPDAGAQPMQVNARSAPAISTPRTSQQQQPGTALQPRQALLQK